MYTIVFMKCLYNCPLLLCYLVFWCCQFYDVIAVVNKTTEGMNEQTNKQMNKVKQMNDQ